MGIIIQINTVKKKETDPMMVPYKEKRFRCVHTIELLLVVFSTTPVTFLKYDCLKAQGNLWDRCLGRG